MVWFGWCSLWSVWTNGVLWDIIESGAIFDLETASRHSEVGEQCDQLGGHHLDHPNLGGLCRRCSSWTLLDLCLCLSHLRHCKFSLFICLLGFIIFLKLKRQELNYKNSKNIKIEDIIKPIRELSLKPVRLILY